MQSDEKHPTRPLTNILKRLTSELRGIRKEKKGQCQLCRW